MGWFDDDDDDDEEESRKRPRPGLINLEIGEAKGSGADFPVIEDNKGNLEGHKEHGEDEEDPLDAFMKDLKSSNDKEDNRVKSPSGTRLDVENEEEATSHWQNQEESNEPGTKSDAQGFDDSLETANEARLALHQTFHKATNASRQEHRQVDIQLEKVQHAAMEYAPIEKKILSQASTTSAGHDWRREHKISCHPPLDPIYTFAELRGILPDQTMEWIANQPGISAPTLVQAQTFSVALSGKDAIITASTGSGKTLAYILPLLAHLEYNNTSDSKEQQQSGPASSIRRKSRALVLVPTRELALQVEKVAKSVFSSLKFNVMAITGGNMGRYQLSQALVKTKPHLLVATPGRLLDVLSAQQKSKSNWLLQEISFLVLDEADKMLQLGFAAQVTQILESLRPDRQSLLTSATLHGKLERHCQQWMHIPTRISVGRTGISSEHVQQHVLCLPSIEAKKAFLKESVATFCNVGRTIVFCATRDGCEELAQVLQDDASNASGLGSVKSTDPGQVVPDFQTLHGDKHPSDRKAALRAFTKGQIKLLLATDVAGRGLDIPQVATVINYDPAKNWDIHVHRIGRAGRLSANDGGKRQDGSAYTLLTPKNADFAQTLVQAYEREGRSVDAQVRSLANSSRRNSAGVGHKRGKVGLGFSSYEGASSSKKRSRWS